MQCLFCFNEIGKIDSTKSNKKLICPRCGQEIDLRFDVLDDGKSRKGKIKIHQFINRLKKCDNVSSVNLIFSDETWTPSSFIETLIYLDNEVFTLIFGIKKRLFLSVFLKYPHVISELLIPYQDKFEWILYNKMNKPSSTKDSHSESVDVKSNDSNCCDPLDDFFDETKNNDN